METKKAFSEARVYVGTYAKYAGGSIEGAWLNISDYNSLEDFLEACRELHEDEDEPEFMFQDWENIPSELISECGIDGAIFEVQDELDEDEEAPFLAWVEYHGWDIKKDPDRAVDTFRDQYCGEWESERAYAEQLFDELYLHEIPEHLQSYIDYEAFARDLFMDGYDYVNGYVFRTY